MTCSAWEAGPREIVAVLMNRQFGLFSYLCRVNNTQSLALNNE